MPLSGLMWRSRDRDHPDIVAEAYYDSDRHEYVVVAMRGAVRLEKRFHARYDPRYGVDIDDQREFKNVATQLSDELVGEKEAGGEGP